jgi:uncharacterized membrane protein (UPF0127 family)
VKNCSIALALLAATLASCNEAKRPTSASPSNAAPPLLALQDPPYLTKAQPRLQTLKLYLGAEELAAELAMKPVEIYTGMMWRTNMAENDAMLFVFPNAEPRAFYMRNTYVPLSLAYIEPDGTIAEIHDLQPRDETPVPSQSKNVQFVLEVRQGWFKRHNIASGTMVRSQYGELKNSFSFRRTP